MRIYTYHPGYDPTLHPYIGTLPKVLILSGQPGNATYTAIYPDSSLIERYGSEEMRREMCRGDRDVFAYVIEHYACTETTL